MSASSKCAMALQWCLLLLVLLILSPLNHAKGDETLQYLQINYSKAMQPLIRMAASEQKLDMVFDTSSGNTILFVREEGACNPKNFDRCYSYGQSADLRTVRICEENLPDLHIDCQTGGGDKYLCNRYLVTRKGTPLPNLEKAFAHGDQLVIDGVEYDLQGIEGEEISDVELLGDNNELLRFTSSPVRLLVSQPLVQHDDVSLPLFEGTSGLFGGSGDSLSCRATSIWGQLLRHKEFSNFSLDFYPPERAYFAFHAEGGAGDSRIVFNPKPRNETIWSQPKQTGDARSNGMYSFMMFHPSVCGVDLLHNMSSNWLTVIDTSGPCLTLPPFLFDRLMVHIPVTCPFALGEPAKGRLCRPDRKGRAAGEVALPSFRFQLADEDGVNDTSFVDIPLERLVVLDETGTDEMLCVARSDDDQVFRIDMMFAHIGFGSLAVAAVYTVIDVSNPHQKIGLIPRGNVSAESTDAFCTPAVVCVSPMQIYDPPTNQCIDPECSVYMFMSLDEETKMCVWNRIAPVSLAIAVVALVALDLFSHRLYKQAIDKASEVCQ